MIDTLKHLSLVCFECDLSLGGSGLWEGDVVGCDCGRTYRGESFSLGFWPQPSPSQVLEIAKEEGFSFLSSIGEL